MVKGVPPLPEVIGIYDVAPPEDAQGVIRFQQVADIGAVPLLLRATRLRDRIYDAAAGLLS